MITSNQILSSNDDTETNQVILTVKSIQTLLLSCIDKCPRAYSARFNILFRLFYFSYHCSIVGVKFYASKNFNKLL